MVSLPSATHQFVRQNPVCMPWQDPWLPLPNDPGVLTTIHWIYFVRFERHWDFGLTDNPKVWDKQLSWFGWFWKKRILKKEFSLVVPQGYYLKSTASDFPLTDNIRMEGNRYVGMMLSRRVKLCSPTRNVQASFFLTVRLNNHWSNKGVTFHRV